MSDLRAIPITRQEVEDFIAQHHRHHLPPVGWVFHVALARGEKIVGVATIGRPVARRLDNGFTAEVTRVCTLDVPEARHAASKLYAMAWRIARQMGYKRLISYTLAEETGTSLIAAGWRALYQTPGHSWDCPSRPRVDKHPLGRKTLWEAIA
jgi:hypothetical protein